MANAKVYMNEDEFAEDVAKIRRGDIIGIEVKNIFSMFNDKKSFFVIY